jgi:hypothetical protein
VIFAINADSEYVIKNGYFYYLAANFIDLFDTKNLQKIKLSTLVINNKSKIFQTFQQFLK